MFGKKASWIMSLVLVVGFLAPSGSQAGLLHKKKECDHSSYSCIHILAPQLWRVYAHHGPKVDVYAPDRFPELPLNYRITPFPCPYATPAEVPYGAGDLPH